MPRLAQTYIYTYTHIYTHTHTYIHIPSPIAHSLEIRICRRRPTRLDLPRLAYTCIYTYPYIYTYKYTYKYAKKNEYRGTVACQDLILAQAITASLEGQQVDEEDKLVLRSAQKRRYACACYRAAIKWKKTKVPISQHGSKAGGTPKSSNGYEKPQSEEQKAEE